MSEIYYLIPIVDLVIKASKTSTGSSSTWWHKIALQLEDDDAKIMAENLGLTDDNDHDTARTMILHQPPHRALVRSNHVEPYIQADITPFWKK